MARTTWIAWAAVLAAVVLVPVAVRIASAADDEPDFPHGDFEEDCSLCHGDEGWSPAVISPEFEHAPGRFPLEGAHAEFDCVDCHEGLAFGEKKFSCAVCHDSPHGELKPHCTQCHKATGFSPVELQPGFEHADGAFPLEGRHAALDCTDCHMDLEFAAMQLSCGDCHDMPHGDLDADCALCHTFEGFVPAVIDAEFDHGAMGFALRGGHSGAQCRHCHETLEFGMADPSCVTCHMDVHRGEFGTDCERCHTPRNFIDRTRMIREHSTTRFPLNGTHLSIDCEDCHVPGERGILQYVNTPWECVSCHLEEYQSTVDPDHEAAGLPTDCQLCHNTQIWSGARFNHTLIPPDAECRDCHLEDYLATSDPNHQTTGFPETCEICHNTRAWSPASFEDHDTQYFPIYSGVHRNRWDACSDCHVNPADFSDFTCFTCHPHNEQRMDNVHEGEVPGYIYDSQACYACHPDGRADDD
jgi:hypothetical protein